MHDMNCFTDMDFVDGILDLEKAIDITFLNAS